MTSPGGERERERFRQTLDGLLYFNPDEPSSAAIGAHLGGSSAPASASASAASRSANEPDARGRRVARPGDRGDFLRRLATFAPGKWFAKPPILSPVPCARKGWECVAVDALRCEACLARVIVRAPPDATREQLLEIAVKQAGKLDDAHEESCAWRGAASPIALARFPRVSDEDLRKDFIARRDALVAVDALPLVTSPIRDALDVSTCVSTTRRVKWLAREATKSESGGAEGEETSTVAVAGKPGPRDDAHAAAATTLALTGWRVDSIVPNRGVVLRCDMCESRAAAWNFPKGTTAKREDGAGVAAAGGVDDWVGANAKRRRATAAATGAQLLGAIGGAFGAFGGAIGSIAGGASPSVPVGGSAFGSGGGFAFGVGAATSTPFGAPPASAGAAAAAAAAPARVADSSPIRPFGAALTAAGVDASAGKRKRGAGGDEAEDKTAAEPEPTPTPTPTPPPSVPGAMHPLRQHRAHCAWATVNADTFSGGLGAGAVAGVRPGWARALDAAAPASEFIHLDDGDDDDDDDDCDGGGGAKTPGGGNDAAGGGGNVDEDGAAVDGTPGGSGVKIDYSYLGARTAVARYVTGES